MGAIGSQITSLTIVYSTAYSGADQSKHQSSESLAFVWGIHRGPVNSPHKWPVTRKMFPFDDVIMHNKNAVKTCRMNHKFSTNSNRYMNDYERFKQQNKIISTLRTTKNIMNKVRISQYERPGMSRNVFLKE